MVGGPWSNDELLTTLELLPTLANAAGAKLDGKVKLDGFDPRTYCASSR
jgi:hypothetical protein